MNSFDPALFRQNFPLIVNHEAITSSLMDVPDNTSSTNIVYFDNGATTQKPECVIDSHQTFYSALNANVHRASHSLSSKATKAFEEARNSVKTLINANSTKEIIWTKGTTESINLIAMTLGRRIVKAGDEILIAVSEHHANIVPWQLVAEDIGATIKIIKLDKMGYIDVDDFEQKLSSNTKIVCFSHVSNVIGKRNPVNKIIQKSKSVGAVTVVDGAQAIAHFSIDVQALDCDFYAFSAHKMFGPTGVGVLYGKRSLLESMPPYQGGGEMIKRVSFNTTTTFNELPFKFEAGTPNIAGVISFNKSIQFLKAYDEKEIQRYEKKLTSYCYQSLKNLSLSTNQSVKFVVSGQPDIPVISFSISSHHNHDIAMALNSYGIAIRSGHHCAMPLMEYLNISGCLRVSLAAYNTFEEVDYFIHCLKQILIDDKALSNVLPDDTSQNTLSESKAEANHASAMIIAQFSAIKSWDSRHRQIMLLGKELDRLDKHARNEQTLISGCESLAWLKAEKNKDNFCFHADSEAKVIRGLLVIVLAAFNNKTAEQIQTFDIEGYFETLGLIQHLSPSRGNGVLAIVDKIKKLAV